MVSKEITQVNSRLMILSIHLHYSKNLKIRLKLECEIGVTTESRAEMLR